VEDGAVDFVRPREEGADLAFVLEDGAVDFARPRAVGAGLACVREDGERPLALPARDGVPGRPVGREAASGSRVVRGRDICS
jgi:hypothetical protein